MWSPRCGPPMDRAHTHAWFSSSLYSERIPFLTPRRLSHLPVTPRASLGQEVLVTHPGSIFFYHKPCSTASPVALAASEGSRLRSDTFNTTLALCLMLLPQPWAECCSRDLQKVSAKESFLLAKLYTVISGQHPQSLSRLPPSCSCPYLNLPTPTTLFPFHVTPPHPSPQKSPFFLLSKVLS